jgi:geranylgeranyl pyrophosphate synthase
MDDTTVAAILDAVVGCGAGRAAREVAQHHAVAASAALDGLPDSPATDALRAVAHYVVRRAS